MSSNTTTRSQTDTYTETRAEYVMLKVFEDLTGLVVSKRTDLESGNIKKWKEDILFLMSLKALIMFDILIYSGSQSVEGKAFRYELQSDGQILADDRSGGIDWYDDIPVGSKVRMLIYRDRNNIEAEKYLRKRGYVAGKSVKGQFDESSNRTYSKQSYGLKRSYYKF